MRLRKNNNTPALLVPHLNSRQTPGQSFGITPPYITCHEEVVWVMWVMCGLVWGGLVLLPYCGVGGEVVCKVGKVRGDVRVTRSGHPVELMLERENTPIYFTKYFESRT